MSDKTPRECSESSNQVATKDLPLTWSNFDALLKKRLASGRRKFNREKKKHEANGTSFQISWKSYVEPDVYWKKHMSKSIRFTLITDLYAHDPERKFPAWISPDGEWLTCDYHDTFYTGQIIGIKAWEIINNTTCDPENLPKLRDYDDCPKELSNKGWIRVTIDHSQLIHNKINVVSYKEPTDKQTETLKNNGINYDSQRFYAPTEDKSGREECRTFLIHLPAERRALRAFNGHNLSYIDSYIDNELEYKSGWVAPNGTYYALDDKDDGVDTILGYSYGICYELHMIPKDAKVIKDFVTHLESLGWIRVVGEKWILGKKRVRKLQFKTVIQWAEKYGEPLTWDEREMHSTSVEVGLFGGD